MNANRQSSGCHLFKERFYGKDMTFHLIPLLSCQYYARLSCVFQCVAILINLCKTKWTCSVCRNVWPERFTREPLSAVEVPAPFGRAIDNLKKLGTTFSISQKLSVIRDTFKALTEVITQANSL